MNEANNTATRQERRTAARRTQILEAAAGVFARKGYPRATTAEIAALAGVSEGTIYNYFESKHDLLVGIMADLAAALPGDAPPANNTPLIPQMLQEHLRFEEANGAMLRVVLSEVLVDVHLAGHYYETLLAPALAQIESTIRSGQAGTPALEPALTAHVLNALFTGLFIQGSLGAPLSSSQLAALAETMSRLLLSHADTTPLPQGS